MALCCALVICDSCMQPGAGSILQTKADCAALQVQDALTRNLARQFGPQSVRVIGVNPAWVKTEAITALASVLQVRPVKHRAQSDVLVHPHAWCMPWFMVWRCCYVAKRGCHSSGCHGGCGCAPLHRLLAFLGAVHSGCAQHSDMQQQLPCVLQKFSVPAPSLLLLQKPEDDLIAALGPGHALGRISSADEQVCGRRLVADRVLVVCSA